MNVSAIIVTRGDVDLEPVLRSLPSEWEILVWNNGRGVLSRGAGVYYPAADLSVYGRYAAIEYTDAELIYVQDDDCMVSDPRQVLVAWLHAGKYSYDGRGAAPWGSAPRDVTDHVVCNMPQEFRHSFYKEHALVGFGACFHRDAPQRAFIKYERARRMDEMQGAAGEFFRRTCDIVFTGLTPRVLADVPKEDMPWASDANRMWKQPSHQEERETMLRYVKGML